MEAEGSQFDESTGPSVMAINGVPHQWEPTLGCDRRFFKGQDESFMQKLNEQTICEAAQKRKGKARQTRAVSSTHEEGPSTQKEDMRYEEVQLVNQTREKQGSSSSSQVVENTLHSPRV